MINELEKKSQREKNKGQSIKNQRKEESIPEKIKYQGRAKYPRIALHLILCPQVTKARTQTNRKLKSKK